AVLSNGEASNLAAGAGLVFTPGDGTILLTVDDCNDMPLAGATISSSPPGAVRYFDSVQPSMTATATDIGGVAMIANLPPGNVKVTASVSGMTLPERDFTVVAD